MNIELQPTLPNNKAANSIAMAWDRLHQMLLENNTLSSKDLCLLSETIQRLTSSLARIQDIQQKSITKRKTTVLSPQQLQAIEEQLLLF
ncbi:MAG TPA: hypothetical protein DHV51_02460 [Opitutae bacterium]|nr:hypothetical protein [Opitutae bacterium]